ncbi:hypothetical protein KI688_003571 [Linnemannia hyalina]|uniref:Uncharacterized protein n=1 Tax=Linnemannia hyalina TaxID=64524 RepID=A0A9P7XPQ5_9FUNG|nr:hypothetical protein KI688_003571 [Linnemannia hyalina]
MTIQGVYLESVDIHSDEFKDFAARFQRRLVSLYEINYAELVCGYLGDATEWGSTAYYHGTSHCGCVDRRICNDSNTRINVHEWCTSNICSTKGIMTSGHLRTKLAFNMEGHFFSPLVTTAIDYAGYRSSKVYASNFLSIFICIARKVQSSQKGAHFYYVQDDSEILPVFLAIVRV